MYTPLSRGFLSKGRHLAMAIVLGGACFALTASVFSQQVYGYSAVKGKVKASSAVVRESASTSSACAFCVKSGEEILILSEETKGDSVVWYKIQVLNSTGYIRSDLVTKSKETVEVKDEKPENDVKTTEDASASSNTETVSEAKTEIKSDTTASSNKTGIIKGASVRIRDKEVSGAIVVQLNTGNEFTILEEVQGSDGYTWYKISFNYQNESKEGYVRSDLVTVSSGKVSETVAVADEDFEKTIGELPESYKNQLRALHEKYPNWKIVPVNTGLSWNDVVSAECAIGKNLTSISSIASWKSTDPRAYNQAKGEWYGFDGGAWASASPEVIKYYLDPRNFLDDSGIFQFETLEFEDYQNDVGCANILANSFMSGSYVDSDGVTKSYASTFVDAGRTNGISPYLLASRCLQEQGLYGKSECVLGNVPGFENIFNFFNIGAYAAGGLTASANGLVYASGTDEAYGRPWNSRYASIVGSAKYISEKYVKKGQNTLYFQKFNVINSENGIFSHQYMSNICAASAEGSRLKKAYPELNTSLMFRIPYYSDMPEEACERPGSLELKVIQ